jgi:hypothetical protein
MRDLTFLKGGEVVSSRSTPHEPYPESAPTRRTKTVRLPLTWNGVALGRQIIRAAANRGDVTVVAALESQIDQMALRLQLAEIRASGRHRR